MKEETEEEGGGIRRIITAASKESGAQASPWASPPEPAAEPAEGLLVAVWEQKDNVEKE